MKIQEINQNEPEIQRKIKNKKKRRNFKRLLFWIKFILITALLVTTIVLLALSPVFNITKIEVKGSQHYKNEEIIAATGIVIGANGFKTIGSDVKNIITFRYGPAENNIIKNYPYIKSVIVRFIVPGKVRVTITERKPEIVVPHGEENLLLDKEAHVLEIFDKKQNKGLPQMIGLKIKQSKLGQALEIEDPKAYDDALRLLDQIRLTDEKNDIKMYKLLNYVDVSDRGNIRISLDSRLTINFGNLSDLDYRLQFCRKIVFEKLAKEDKGFLDMTTENPSFTPKK